ncbi:MAG TPA: radical SAM protein [Candidatus Desulfofervidus auxilii]|uniref:Radical SAM protein n=1 Tax=Desulfofervidus auxilii TaxID=1621989 RepID=A0A7V1N266_DESA2|nr:radical SAM protein [Candidatus Desulfofervidus auxilii]
MLNELPYVVYADAQGRIYNHPYLKAIGKSGEQIVVPKPQDFIPLPEGSKLFFLPKCPPIGYDEKKGHIYLLEVSPFSDKPCYGVAAFMPPGYVRCLLPAAEYIHKDCIFPLWAYTAIGWYDHQYWVPAFLIEDNPHWYPSQYDDRSLLPKIKKKLSHFPNNRLLKHLKRCATEFHCFAAKNAFYERWELPVPVSPACNARCLGCLSWQEENSCLPSHHRIQFVPAVEEIVEIALPHVLYAQQPIISFGQGCEGEPLLAGDTIAESIRIIRQKTDKGTINLNTNGSIPKMVSKIIDAGLDSIRISLASAQPEYYHRYHRPINYNFKAVKDTIKLAKEKGIFTMINYLVFPGLSDTMEEINALKQLVAETHLDLIQLKNLNIDPFWYIKQMQIPYTAGIGIKNMMEELKKEFPELKWGYFNQYLKNG